MKTTVSDKMIVLDTPDQIAVFRMMAIEKGCRIYADTGMKVARNLPTVKALRRQYPEILGGCRTYRQVADTMKAYLDEHLITADG
jgi:hypothetical protein